MVKMSRFTHTYDLGEAVALYHSLRMKPVYLTKIAYKGLQEWLASPFCNVENTPLELRKEIEELIKYKIIVTHNDEDDKILNFVKSRIPKPAINVCYMILSEQCNLACKYCFLGNNDLKKRKEFLLENMTLSIADKAIEFFIRQLKASNLNYELNTPIIIFYGGEPLVNYETLIYIVKKINDLRDIEPCIKNVQFSVVTNGLLLNEERFVALKELGVSIAISIDGFSKEANAMRVDTSGTPIFEKLLNILNLAKQLDVRLSLSVTLSEETIKDTTAILELLEEYNIKGFGFNIMMSSEEFVLPESYNDAAAKFILDEFIELRKKGIYEDRMMRKVKAFVQSKIYFSDCAATAGGQIVIAPNGQVGICHGCLHDKQYFVSHVDEKDFLAIENSTFIEWSQITPVNNEYCYSCEALGICGGGCPVNAMRLKPGNSIHSVDERFCVHAKQTLHFLVEDLYRIISKG